MSNDVQQYIQYFRDQLPKIARIEDRLYRKALYVTVIDTLSRAGFPQISKHRKRVITFLNECSGWGDKNRVSPLQLKLVLESENKTSGALYADAKSRVEGWTYGAIIRSDSDPPIEQLRSLASPDEQRILENARYVQPLYTYRNHLVHEFRQPGYGVEFVDDTSTPYYHGMEGSPWELVFPDQFFHNLCSSCIDGLETHLIRSNLDPYAAYHFGTLWGRSWHI